MAIVVKAVSVLHVRRRRERRAAKGRRRRGKAARRRRRVVVGVVGVRGRRAWGRRVAGIAAAHGGHRVWGRRRGGSWGRCRCFAEKGVQLGLAGGNRGGSRCVSGKSGYDLLELGRVRQDGGHEVWVGLDHGNKGRVGLERGQLGRELEGELWGKLEEAVVVIVVGGCRRRGMELLRGRGGGSGCDVGGGVKGVDEAELSLGVAGVVGDDDGGGVVLEAPVCGNGRLCGGRGDLGQEKVGDGERRALTGQLLLHGL